MTNATLIYLFRPDGMLHGQTPNPNVPSTAGSAQLLHIINAYDLSPTVETILPTLIPLVAVALAASQGFIVIRWIVEAVVERVFWRGSVEEIEVQKMSARHSDQTGVELEKLKSRHHESLTGGFWNGGEEGAREIGRMGKVE